MIFVKFIYGFSLGTLTSYLAEASRKAAIALLLFLFGILVVTISFSSYETLIAVESLFWILDSASFILGCLFGSFFGKSLYVMRRK